MFLKIAQRVCTKGGKLMFLLFHAEKKQGAWYVVNKNMLDLVGHHKSGVKQVLDQVHVFMI